jgi:hypothetical protein
MSNPSHEIVPSDAGVRLLVSLIMARSRCERNGTIGLGHVQKPMRAMETLVRTPQGDQPLRHGVRKAHKPRARNTTDRQQYLRQGLIHLLSWGQSPAVGWPSDEDAIRCGFREFR